MSNAFGDMLRRARRAAGLPMRSVAERMTWSIAYVSDVERGRRAPPSDKSIREIARLLGSEPEPWLTAAAVQRGVVMVDGLDDDAVKHVVALAEALRAERKG